MSYVIYNKETTVILEARARSVGCYITRYKTESAAKAALTRLDKKGLLGELRTEVEGGVERFPYIKSDFAIAESGSFAVNVEKTRMVRSAMNGAMVEESVNTPYSVSVASENYWCS